MLTLFPDSGLAAILENETTAEPILLLPSKNAQDQVILYLQPRASLPRGLRTKRADQILDSAFVSQRRLGANLVWHYFGKGLKEFTDNVFSAIFEDTDKLNAFARVSQHFTGSLLPGALHESVDGHENGFEIFLNLRRAAYSFEAVPSESTDDWIDRPFSMINKSISSVIPTVPKLLGEQVQEKLQEEISSGSASLREIFLQTSSSEEALEKIVSCVMEKKGSIISDLACHIEPKLQEEIKFQKDLQTVLEYMESRIEGYTDNTEGSFFDGHKISAGFSLKQVIDNNVQSRDLLTKCLRSLDLPTVEELAAEYVPGHVYDDQNDYEPDTYVDHGLAAALLMLDVNMYYRQLQKSLVSANQSIRPDSGVQLLRSGFIVDWQRAVYGLRLSQVELHSEALLATAVHNLYPEFLPGGAKKYKTSSAPNPFVFISLLADGLQEWDRDRIQNAARSEVGRQLYASDYDIDIQGNYITISLQGESIDISSERKNLREHLAEYLFDIEKVIRLRASET